MFTINKASAQSVPVALPPADATAPEGCVSLDSFFSDPYVIEHLALAATLKKNQSGTLLSNIFNKRDVCFDSEQKIRDADYAIKDGFLYRAHYADPHTVTSAGVTRNTQENEEECFDDYLAKLFEHTAGHSSQGAILSFSSHEKTAKKFMAEGKLLLKVDADSEADKNEFISVPQLILQHGGRLLKAGKIDKLTLLSALDQLNNREREFFYIGKPHGYRYGELPPYKLAFGEAAQPVTTHVAARDQEPVAAAVVLREDKTGVARDRICYPGVSSCLTITFRHENFLAGAHLTIATDKNALKDVLKEIKALNPNKPIEIIVASPFSVYKIGVSDKELNTRSKLKKIIGRIFPDTSIRLVDTSDIRLSHILVSKNSLEYVNESNFRVIGNHCPDASAFAKSAETVLPDRPTPLASLASSSSGAVTRSALSAWLKETDLPSRRSEEQVLKDLKEAGFAVTASQLKKAWSDALPAGDAVLASAPDNPSSEIASPEIKKLRSIRTLTTLKHQHGMPNQDRQRELNALLKLGPQLADVARHPGKEMLETILDKDISPAGYSQMSSEFSQALATDYFETLDDTLKSEENPTGDPPLASMLNPLKDHLLENRGQQNMHPWNDGLIRTLSTAGKGAQAQRAARALSAELERDPDIGTAWKPGSSAAPSPEAERIREKLTQLSTREGFIQKEQRLTGLLSRRDRNIQQDRERLALKAAADRAKRREADRQAWNAFNRHVDNMVAGGQDLRARHARERSEIDARVSRDYHARMDAWQSTREEMGKKMQAILQALAAKSGTAAARKMSVPANLGPIISTADRLRNEADAAITAFTWALQKNLTEGELKQRLTDMERVTEKLVAEEQHLFNQVAGLIEKKVSVARPDEREVDTLLGQLAQEVMTERLPDINRTHGLQDLSSERRAEREPQKIALARSAYDKVGKE